MSSIWDCRWWPSLRWPARGWTACWARCRAGIRWSASAGWPRGSSAGSIAGPPRAGCPAWPVSWRGPLPCCLAWPSPPGSPRGHRTRPGCAPGSPISSRCTSPSARAACTTTSRPSPQRCGAATCPARAAWPRASSRATCATRMKKPSPAPRWNRPWRTAAMPSSRRCSGSSSAARRAWCCIAWPIRSMPCGAIAMPASAASAGPRRASMTC